MFTLTEHLIPQSGPVRIKVCGITCAEDAALALELGVDALGFNFFPGSPRCLNLERDAVWIREEVPATAQKIAVAVNPTRAQISQWLQAGVADVIQLHGDEDEDFCRALREDGVPFVKAIRVRDQTALLRPERFHCSWLVIDAYQSHAFGGTGHQIDWDLAAEFIAAQHMADRQVILSGGLKPGNVADAIRRTRPAGVDVASGVEHKSNPRRKDAILMREFIERVRGAVS